MSIDEIEQRAADNAELLRRSERALAVAEATITELRAGNLAGETRISELAEEIAGLRKAIETRPVIEQAKGMIMASAGCGPDEAFQLLVSQSQHENRKLHIVAENLVRSKIRPSFN